MKLVILEKTVLKMYFLRINFLRVRVPSVREREVNKGVLLSFFWARNFRKVLLSFFLDKKVPFAKI